MPGDTCPANGIYTLVPLTNNKPNQSGAAGRKFGVWKPKIRLIFLNRDSVIPKAISLIYLYACFKVPSRRNGRNLP